MPTTKRGVQLVAVGITCLAVYYLRFHGSDALEIAQTSIPPTFSWKDIPSSKELDWMPCYQNRECARLQVPLDYDDPTGRQASIALVRKKAEVPHTSPSYGGPVLMNPGGPGGSGVDMVRGPAADLISTILGPQFDVVGFDPRGIARSTPRATIFKSDAQRAIFLQDGTERWMKDHNAVALAWGRALAVNALAQEDDDGYLQHIRTDNTARDMLSIVEAHGRDKLLYWGFSYGSVLGATFAAMFPDRVGRLVIDGVMDAENYYSTLWDGNLLDTDRALESFFTGCAEAGPEVCPFWAADPSDIRQNLTNLYSNLAREPIPVAKQHTLGVVDDTWVRVAVFISLYSPYAQFPLLGEILGDPKKHAQTLLDNFGLPPFDCACGTAEEQSAVDEGTVVVSCNDGDEVPADLEPLLGFYDDFSKRSAWGPLWARGRIRCAGWPRHPKNRFQGPFVANTSHPIMLIGNTADPVTPLWAANKMSKGFIGSVVLTQDSPGHCSIAAPSTCTQEHIREYFGKGTLPPPGTVCPVDFKPFPAAANRVADASFDQAVLSPTQLAIRDAVAALSKMPIISRRFSFL